MLLSEAEGNTEQEWPKAVTLLSTSLRSRIRPCDRFACKAPQRSLSGNAVAAGFHPQSRWSTAHAGHCFSGGQDRTAGVVTVLNAAYEEDFLGFSYGFRPRRSQHDALDALHWDTVRLLERSALQAALSELPKAQPRRLVMDEFALFKGNRYASVVLDADTRRVLWIGEGHSRAAVRTFFEELGPEGCARIEAVAMGMNTAFGCFCVILKI